MTQPLSIIQRRKRDERPIFTPGSKIEDSILQNELTLTRGNNTECMTINPEMIAPQQVNSWSCHGFPSGLGQILQVVKAPYKYG